MYELRVDTVPRRFAGFLLKSALSKLCTSGLRNWGIPNLALYTEHIQHLRLLLNINMEIENRVSLQIVR